MNGKALHLQIMIPITRNSKEAKMQYPCVVYMQGSAWKEQNVFAKIGMLGRLAERGYVVAIAEYRHSGIAKFPAQAVDARNAIRFMKKIRNFIRLMLIIFLLQVIHQADIRPCLPALLRTMMKTQICILE